MALYNNFSDKDGLAVDYVFQQLFNNVLSHPTSFSFAALLDGQVSVFQLPNVASGSNAIQLTTGQRLSFDGTASDCYLTGGTFSGSPAIIGATNSAFAIPGGSFVGSNIQSYSQGQAGGGFSIHGAVSDSASAVAVTINNLNTPLTTSGAKLLSVRNNNVEKAYFDKDGGLQVTGVGTGANAFSIPTNTRLALDGASGTHYFYWDTAAIQTSASQVWQNVIQISGASNQIKTIGSNTLNIDSGISDGASAVGITSNSLNTLTTVGAKIHSFRNNSTEKLAVGKNGQLVAPTGNADSVVGTATLVAGTVTVSTTAVSASSKILYARATSGGTLGHLSLGTITAGTSFVIQSSSGTETSTINWWVIN